MRKWFQSNCQRKTLFVREPTNSINDHDYVYLFALGAVKFAKEADSNRKATFRVIVRNRKVSTRSSILPSGLSFPKLTSVKPTLWRKATCSNYS